MNYRRPNVGDIYKTPWKETSREYPYKPIGYKWRVGYIVKVIDDDVIVCEITKHSPRDNFPGEIFLGANSFSFGLNLESTIRLSQQLKLNYKDLGDYVGKVDDDTREYIQEEFDNLSKYRVDIYKMPKFGHFEKLAEEKSNIKNKVVSIMKELHKEGYLDMEHINRVFEILDDEHVKYSTEDVTEIFKDNFDKIALELEEARQQTALKSNGIYSVMSDTWIKEPVAADIPEVDKESFDKLFKEWENRYLTLVDNPTVESIEDFIEDIYDLRKKSIAEEGEYGLGNLVFKECRNKGYLDNLRDLKNELKSEELSLHDLEEEFYSNRKSRIDTYRRYAQIDKSTKINDDNLDEWALNKTSCELNYPVDWLKEELLDKEYDIYGKLRRSIYEED